MASPDLDDYKRQQYVQFLINFYLSKTHMKLEPVGYIQGLHNTETYGLSGIEYAEAMRFRDIIKKQGIFAKFQNMDSDKDKIEMLFDMSEEQCEKVLNVINA